MAPSTPPLPGPERGNRIGRRKFRNRSEHRLLRGSTATWLPTAQVWCVAAYKLRAGGSYPGGPRQEPARNVTSYPNEAPTKLQPSHQVGWPLPLGETFLGLQQPVQCYRSKDCGAVRQETAPTLGLPCRVKPQTCSAFEPSCLAHRAAVVPALGIFRLALREGREHHLTLSFGLTLSGSRQEVSTDTGHPRPRCDRGYPVSCGATG